MKIRKETGVHPFKTIYVNYMPITSYLKAEARTVWQILSAFCKVLLS